MQNQTDSHDYRGAWSPQPPPPSPRKSYRLLIVVAVVLLAALGYGVARVILQGEPANVSAPAATKTVAIPTSQPIVAATQPAPTPAPSPCATNARAGRWIVVSISQRHLWACSADNHLFDTPVITGIAYLAADLTPTGTYHIYAKQTDRTLNGSDSTGSWSDFVHYYMPFLDNRYGSYGFHDATWRKASDFGNIDPNSSNASHGCVEMSLAAATWLYNWASVGTVVVIQA